MATVIDTTAIPNPNNLDVALNSRKSKSDSDVSSSVAEMDTKGDCSESKRVQSTEMDGAETHLFNTDIAQLMSLIINSLYSEKEIFLRELISNASDACDKIRHKSLTDPNALSADSTLQISVAGDAEKNTIVITDSGVGMTKLDLINNLGTIAGSGTRHFMQTLQNSSTAAGGNANTINMIGQFGVGFYSSYLVADRVIVQSKHDDDVQWMWVSEAGSGFTVKRDSADDIKRGTRITLFLKKDQVQFAQEKELKKLIKRHSEFIQYPILLLCTKLEDKPEETVAIPKEDSVVEDVKKVSIEDAPPIPTSEATADKKQAKRKKDKIAVKRFEHINTDSALWLKKPEQVRPEEYNALYKSIAMDWEDPLAVKHFSVEGSLEFRGILFVPPRAPFDLFETKKPQNNVKLFVRRVFIMDDCKELVPPWLNFIKGIIDSEDLPLNVSREMLQQTRILAAINKHIVKKSLEIFEELSETPAKYTQFYNAFSKNIKLGIHEDATNRVRLAALLRYYSSKSLKEYTTLKDYVDRMKPTQQKCIYYITGESQDAVHSSPFLEALRQRDFEVLYMTEAMDEYCIQQLKEFKECKFVCVTKENLTFETTEDEKKRKEEQQKEFAPLCEKIKQVLGDKVEKVIVGERVISSPCCIVTTEFGWTANMERIMKAQALRDDNMNPHLSGKKTLEINANHPIMKALLCQSLPTAANTNVSNTDEIKNSGNNTNTESLKSMDISTLDAFICHLWDIALLSSQFPVVDPATFAAISYNLAAAALQRIVPSAVVNAASVASEPAMPALVSEDKPPRRRSSYKCRSCGNPKQDHTLHGCPKSADVSAPETQEVVDDGAPMHEPCDVSAQEAAAPTCASAAVVNAVANDEVDEPQPMQEVD